MTSRRRRLQRLRRRRQRSRRLLALLALAVVAVAIGAQTVARSGENEPNRPRVLALRFEGRLIERVAVQQAGTPLTPAQVARRVRDALPTTITMHRGRARVRYQLNRDLAAARARRGDPLRTRTIVVPGRPLAASIAAPVVKQQLRNDCEAAALEVLLASVDVRVDQLQLLAELPRSGPLDPQTVNGQQVWGDPDQGFVGRPDGGGLAGGFGVYQRPVAAVARRHGIELRDLTETSPKAIYQRLLAGHAVLVWVGLGDGPYGTWQTPAGKPIRVNFNEHTVVLNGIDEQRVLDVVDPLSGARSRWSAQRFEAMWELLGRRALST